MSRRKERHFKKTLASLVSTALVPVPSRAVPPTSPLPANRIARFYTLTAAGLDAMNNPSPLTDTRVDLVLTQDGLDAMNEIPQTGEK